MPRPLRLMLFDSTCGALTLSWRAGALLYRALGRLDAWHGANTWEEGLEWLAAVHPGQPVGEVQYWGHGKWGALKLAGATLDAAALAPGHRFEPRLAALRARLTGPDALFWFRTCETFGKPEGLDFARRWTRYFGCRAAGHTYVIGPLQSGLHVLAPGAEPDWSPTEGLLPDPGARIARWSAPWAPNTITCFGNSVTAAEQTSSSP